MKVSVRNSQIKNLIRSIIVTGLMFISACSDQEFWTNSPSQPSPESTVFTEINPAEPDLSVTQAITQVNNLDKWVLWTGETKLRGANIWQRIVIPDLDGPDFLGSDYIGPPYTQDDFDRLAALGANYVNISGPGLFTELPPYQIDLAVQNQLDSTLEMIQKADMFAVITFRTGPGRSDFTFYREGAGDWFSPELLREWVCEDPDAQDAWVEMWRYTAARYRDHPIVVGYDLMCEPNAAGIRDIYDPDDFYEEYQGSSLDWNHFYPEILNAIREVDPHTPILVGGMGWSSIRWLPYLEPTHDPRTVYLIHQYEPQAQYTHQEGVKNSYPGKFDLDWDGHRDDFNVEWLNNYFQTIDQFQEEWGVPIAVNEYGIVRWIPGGDTFLKDQLLLFEERGLNHAIWMWDPAWEPWTNEVNVMNYRFGQNSLNRKDELPNPLMDILQEYWQLNSLRPSDFYSD